MSSSFTYTATVAFADTDMAGVVHFSKILCYVEEAEHAALADLGVAAISPEGGFPKVNVQCDYRSPLRFGDVAEVVMRVVKLGESSVTWCFAVSVDATLCAEGELTTVYVSRKGQVKSLPEGARVSLLKCLE